MDWPEWSKQYSAGDTDYYIYGGPIETSGYRSICETLEKRRNNKKQKVILILCTGGGNPNAGYRIARALIHHYGAINFRVAVPAECKSAGTLICIGAHSIILFDQGELGPLDVQFQKKDELFQQSSGLDIVRGMTYLKDDALEAFNKFLLDINGGSGLGTKVASEIASNLVRGIYEPIFAQIDPVRLGEMNAALQIAHEYGTRLNKKSANLKDNALSKLINNYPTHGFVIDRAEARDLFIRVEPPDERVALAGKFALDMAWQKGRQTTPNVLDLGEFFEDIFPNETTNDEHESASQPGAQPEPTGTAAVTGTNGGQPSQVDEPKQLPNAG